MPSDRAQRSRTLLLAAKEFRDSLGGSPASLQFAIDQLHKATDDALPNAAFEAAPGAAGGAGRPTREDLLDAALLEADAASVLLASGVAVGETGGEGDLVLLNATIEQLEASRAQGEALEARRAAFEGPAKVSSASLAEAREAFRGRCDAALEDVVTRTKDIFAEGARTLWEVGPEAVVKAFDRLGEVNDVATAFGRLVRKGLQKLRSAIDKLVGAIGKAALDRVKDELNGLWDALRPGEVADALIARALGVPAVRKAMENLLSDRGLTIEALDRGSGAAFNVSREHDELIGPVRGVLAALGAAATILMLFAAAPPWVGLLAGGYLAVFGAGLVLGMDSVGSRPLLRMARSMQDVVDEVSPAPGVA